MTPIKGSYGIKIGPFIRAWPMKLLAWSKKFNICYTVSSLSAGAE